MSTKPEQERGGGRASQAERRRFSRVSFRTFVTTCAEGRDACEVELVDLSLKGALIRRPAGWMTHLDDALRVELRLDDSGAMIGAEGEPPVLIVMETRIAHQREGFIGLRCEQIDIESFTHLRRLLELNLADAAQVKRELAALGE